MSVSSFGDVHFVLFVLVLSSTSHGIPDVCRYFGTSFLLSFQLGVNAQRAALPSRLSDLGAAKRLVLGRVLCVSQV